MFSPTCVGMVRTQFDPAYSQTGSPHVRGDGPNADNLPFCETSGSPHVRGDGPAQQSSSPGTGASSPHVRGDGPLAIGGVQRLDHVLPTCVGMVRKTDGAQPNTGRSPHVRGDGPSCAVAPLSATIVLPTCVGMVRAKTVGSPAVERVLPTCVGMVRAQKQPSRAVQFSPRAWGWSDCDIAQRKTWIVLPTCVGMVRNVVP